MKIGVTSLHHWPLAIKATEREPKSRSTALPAPLRNELSRPLPESTAVIRMKRATLMVIRSTVKNRGEPACATVLAGAAGTESLPQRGQVLTEAAINPRQA